MGDTYFSDKIKQRELITEVLCTTGSAISTNQIIDRVNIKVEEIKKKYPEFPRLSHPTAEKILKTEFKGFVNEQVVEYGNRELHLWNPDKEKLKHIKMFKVTSKGIEIQEN